MTHIPPMDENGSRSLTNVLAATVSGTAMEWYDYYLFATASALIFPHVFFPNFSPMAGSIAAFGSFAAGFFVRPIGGVVFGHLGDKIGRRRVLMITLLLMGIATTCIGLVPGYAAIGLAAPALIVLLRLLQGFGAGAEYAGAVIMTAESCPSERRGFYCAIPYIGVSIGLLLSTAFLSGISQLSEMAQMSWGWRLPFLFSAVITLVGFYQRFRLFETPVFDEISKRKEIEKVPFAELWKHSRRPLLACWGARLGDNSLAYIFESFVIVYVTQTLGLPKQMILHALLVSAAISIVTVPVFGAMTDRYGRRALYAGGAIGSALFAYPFFLLMQTGNTLVIWGAMIAASAIFKCMMTGAQAAFFAELFPARYRYSGFAIGREVTSPIAGGLTPIITTGLYAITGQIWAVVAYLVFLCVVTAGSVLSAPETRQASLR